MANYKVRKKSSKYASFMQAYKVNTPKYKFYVERGGERDKPVILLIMGLGAQSLAWSNLFCKRLIESGYHVIRFDNRDIGKSSKLKHKNSLLKKNQPLNKQLKLISRFKLGLPLPLNTDDIPYNLYAMAEDVNQLLTALKIESCHVLGMSMGGMIAQILAANYPHRVQKLGLLATSNNQPFLPPPHLQALKALLAPMPNKKDTKAIIEKKVELLRSIGSPAYFNEYTTRKHAAILHNRKFYPKGVTRQLLAILATGSLLTIDQKITQPTLIIHGEKDRLLPPAHARALAKAITHAKLQMIPELGHDIPLVLTRYLADNFAIHFAAYDDIEGDSIYPLTKK
ncbi:alpha/beta fold hydrolase [Psychrobacter sp. I-STPA10]|uniref:alpha/beta fold hydrolase n=1 Tax=Psychrobacter sp. I-STPA10 TaxID=2585769 RepID=UPI001E38A983|nr:alpha/beta hydrolase [Psychrobacter sp. I-STPA10]